MEVIPLPCFSFLRMIWISFFVVTVISGIDFESTPKDGNQTRRRRDDILRDHRNETMHMLTVKTKNIIVSIFYDMNGSISPTVEEKWGYQVLLHSVRIAFEVKYLPTLQILLDDASGARNVASSSNV
jgi:hypothetical protein